MKLDLNELMAQAQKLSHDLEGRRAELSRREVEGQAGAGLVTAVMSGTGELLRVRIDPKAIQGDVTLLEDLVVAAVNGALGEVRAVQQRELGGLPAALAGFAGDGGGLT
jgi:DNA-binding YbaB/EbfC family protein